MSSKAAISLIVGLLLLIVTAAGYKQKYFENFEHSLYDAQARLLRSDKTPDPKIKVILIDEAALKTMDHVVGRWPWPRAIWGDLLDYLNLAGARAVLFDILFIEHTV